MVRQSRPRVARNQYSPAGFVFICKGKEPFFEVVRLGVLSTLDFPIAESGHLQKTAEGGDISRQGFGSDFLL